MEILFALQMMSICPILRDVLPFAFVPAEVDEWFRGLIKELKESRLTHPLQHEDLFQMLLNSANKNGNRLIPILQGDCESFSIT